MTKVPEAIVELPLSERGLITLRVAVKKVIEGHAHAGLPIYVERDGKIVKIPADQLTAESGLLESQST
jgi:hypothetical protein